MAIAHSFGELVQEFRPTNEDKKGRVFGYILAHREALDEQGNLLEFVAWVQRGVSCKRDGFKEFGVIQPAHRFATLADVRAYHSATLAKRTAK